MVPQNAAEELSNGMPMDRLPKWSWSRFTHVTKGRENEWFKGSCGSCGYGWWSKDHEQGKSTSLYKSLVLGT